MQSRWMRVIIFLTLSAITCGSTAAFAQIQDGYTVLAADPGAPPPAGAALFSYTSGDGVLVSQAGVGASGLIQSGRIFVDESGALTGIALVNPAAQNASVTFTLRDAAGATIDGKGISLGAHQHTALYISELFAGRPANLTGTLTFDSTQALAAITLRESRNAQGEPVYTTIPVLDLKAPPGNGAVVFPHIAVGGGFTTQILLMNRGADSMHGRIAFIGSDASPLSVLLQSGTISSLQYDIAPQGIYRAEIDGAGPVADGYAVLTPDAGTSSPAGTAVFRFKSGSNVVTEAGVAAGTPTTAARIFVDYIGTQTGVALANPASVPATVTLTLLDRFGAPEVSINQVLPAGGHSAKFVHEMFPIADGYTGLLEIRSSIPIVSIALKLTTNSRNDLVLTTLPSADLTQTSTGGPVVFPHIVIGGGFTTRLILINTSTAADSTGRTAFYKSDGSAFTVPMTGQTGSEFGYRIVQGGGRELYPGNSSTLANIALIGDALAVQTTSELPVNVGNIVHARVQMIDSMGARRDDFDPSMVSFDTSVAEVLDPAGTIRGNKPGFSTISIAAGGVVTNVTATVVQVDSGVNGFATAGIAQDGARRLYLSSTSDNAVLLAQDLKQSPQIYAGVRGISGLKDDLRPQSLFNKPSFLVLNQADGSLYLSDAANNAIRRVRSGPSGRVETLAGTGAAGSADGAVKTASFSNPQGVALDIKGNLWVADSGNHTIRKINLATGVVSTVAGRAGAPGATDGVGTAARFNAPAGIAVEVESSAQALQRQLQGAPPPPVSIIVADSGNGLIRRVKETGEVTTILIAPPLPAAGLLKASAAARDSAAGRPASFSAPAGVAIDAAGNIYVTQPGSGEVDVILQNGVVVGAAQPGTFDSPRSVAIAENGKVLIAGTGPAARQLVYGQPHIASVNPDRFGSTGGQSVTIRGSNFAPDTLLVIGDTIIANRVVIDTQTIRFTTPPLLSGRSTLTASNRGGTAQTLVTVDAVPLSGLPLGYITTVAGGSTYAGEGALATASPMAPGSVAFDTNGNVFILDGLNAKVRRVDGRTGILTTVLGNGQGISSGDNGPAIAAGISSYATGIGFDPAGNLLIADSGIRRVDATTGIIKTIAITQYGFCGDGLDALNACVNDVAGFTTDAKGNIFIADRFNNRIRRVDAKTNIITTFAGNGQAAFGGDNGDAAAASLNEPFAVAVDDVRGAVYIADSANRRVRKVDLATNIITTIAGTGEQSEDLGDGGIGTAAPVSPNALALDNAGNLFISDRGNSRIRKLDVTTGIITTVAGTGEIGSGGDGGPAANASLSDPFGVAVDAAGDLLIADFYQFVVRRVDASTHIITTFAGNRQDEIADDGGPATAASLRLQGGTAVDAAGNLFFASNFRIRRVDGASGSINTIAGGGPSADSAGEGVPATKVQMQPGSGRVAVDDAGNVYIADRYGYRVRRVQAGTNIINTIAGSGLPESSGDGGPATSAGVVPDDLALDKQGNLYIAENDIPGGMNVVRKLDLTTGLISTVAGGGLYLGDSAPATAVKLGPHFRIAVDAAGNIYITDPDNRVIRRVDATTRIITIVAGGGASYSDNQLATSVELSPVAADVDAAGNLYIFDYVYPFAIRKVDAATKVIRTLVVFEGTGLSGLGDNGPAGQASVRYPSDVTIDARGNLFITDTNDSRIRVIRGPLP